MSRKAIKHLISIEPQSCTSEISSASFFQKNNKYSKFSNKSKSNAHGFSYSLRDFSCSTDELLDISLKSTRLINEQYNIIYASNQNISREQKLISFRNGETKKMEAVNFLSVSKIIPIHHSLCFGKRFCYRIVTVGGPNEAKSIVFNSSNQTERDLCIKQIRCAISESLSSIIFEENNLKISIQEAKNLTLKNKYYCEIKLDNLIYARTSVKEMKEILIWGEEFDLMSLPCIEMVSITLWRLPRSKEKHKECQIVSHFNIPIENIDQHCITEKWYSPSPVCLPHSGSKLAHNLTFSAACDIDELPKNNTRTLNQVTDSAPLLRAKSKYSPLKVLDAKYYMEFVEFIKENGINMLREMEAGIKAKYREVLVWSMIQLSISENWVEEFLSDLILKEAQSCDIKIILRGNSMASKSIEFFLKLECQDYLRQILHSTIKDIIHKTNDLEIDQSQLIKRNESISASAMRKRNQRLEMIVDKVLNKIFSNVDIIPRKLIISLLQQNFSQKMSFPILIDKVQNALGPKGSFKITCKTFRNIWNFYFVLREPSAKFPLPPSIITDLLNSVREFNDCDSLGNAQCKRVRSIFSRIRCSLKNFGTIDLEFTQKVVSACFFLRLVCPAIMTPHLFDLLPEYSDNVNINRSFTLVAKCVQNIANFAGIDDTKESYMQSIALHCRDYYNQMSEFINSISTINEATFTTKVYDKHTSPRLAIDSARLSYNIEYHLSTLQTNKYTTLQLEVKEIIDRIKENEINISEENDTIEKMRQNYEYNDIGKTVVSTIESSGYFSTNGPYLGSVNSNLNHSPSSSLSAISHLKFSSPQFLNKHTNMMPISCPSVSESHCNNTVMMDEDPISLRKIIIHEKKRIQLLKELVDNLQFTNAAEAETIDLSSKNLNINIEKVAESKSNVLKYIDFVSNNLNSFQLSQNASSHDSLLKQFIKINAELQSILIKSSAENSNQQ